MNLRLAVVIPVFNEGESLRNTLPQLVREIYEIDKDITVFYVNDGSTDNTFEVLLGISNAENFSNLQILALEENKGYGGALRYGAKIAQDRGFQAVVFMDSDLTNPTSEILGLVSKLETHDLVKASRYVKGADASEVPWRRRCFSIVGNFLLRLLFRSPIQDVTNGFRAWRLEQYLSFDCKRNGFDSIVEEFYFARVMNFRISELPSTLKSRGGGMRVSSSSYTFKTFYNYLAPALLYFSRRFK
jgi:dolichol-phosphate mannosyltransferase